MRVFVAFLFVLIVLAAHARGMDEVTLLRDGREQTVAGRIVVTAEDGGLLLLSPDGVLWTIQPTEIVRKSDDEKAFRPLSKDELSKQLTSELRGFEIYQTHHWLICHNTSREYAAWCGALFERLHLAFTNFWSRKGLKLDVGEFPLVAVVFSSKDAYVKYAQSELGSAAESVIGYYSLKTNRITMYDLTGIEALRAPGDRRGTTGQINQMLARPEAEQLVATIIHEATHQIAFNCGLQTRYADIPLWFSEGLAVYFETPDLQSARGWRTIGAVNTGRLEQFRSYLANRPPRSLASLIVEDKRLRDAPTALDAYAEAWALTYYLMRQHPKKYLAYLQMLSKKKELLWDNPETRLREFQAVFGDNLQELDADFLRSIQKLR